ncbi:hypothetical protein BGZ67_008115 [Mortierella alpina]|nr:hypothetical protein BGZ67_008115 [Mortierella alpina]
MTAEHEHASERQPLLTSSHDDPSNVDSSSSKLLPLAALPLQDEREQDEDQDQDHGHAGDEARRLAHIQSLPWYKRPSIAWILPFVFMVAIVMGLSQVPQEQLIIKIICKEYFKDRGFPTLPSNSSALLPLTGGNDDPCKAAPIQALAAVVLGRYRSLKSVTGIFTLGYITSLSDKFGRKTLIFLTLIPVALTQALIVFMALPSTNLGLAPLYVDAFFMGSLGAGMLLEPCITAYVADCTPREGRSLAMGYVMVALSVGLIAGPALGGLLLRMQGGDDSSAIMISILTLIVLTLYAIVLPESLMKNARSKDIGVVGRTPDTIKVQDVSILIRAKKFFSAILDPLILLLPGKMDASGDINILPSKYTLVFLVAAYGFLQFAAFGTILLLIPYTNTVFKWTTEQGSNYVAFNGAASLVVYVAIFPALQKLYSIFVEREDLKGKDTVPLPHSEHSEIGQGHAESQTPSEGEIQRKASDTAKQDRAVRKDLFFFIFGTVVYIISYLLMHLFQAEPSFYFTTFTRSLASVAAPSFLSLFTSYVPSHQTGTVLGGISVLDAIYMAISSLLYSTIFSKTSSTMPSAIFLVSSAFSMVSFLGGLVVLSTYKRAHVYTSQ